ncbi:NADH-dependent flavin oxidoreductase nadA [Lasiodiplodia hormozganensis]|uniref:NADH-dependent flavin oxidoreductase nadA n=1 Tax=Lasiodiplodia hormozganensis TaxID=869390 RepID=A0AA40CMF0_9PEZI|nr:NADH-dependent flavin oxidoreductase nadA [Lasiodiplodia hormozganensis]
MDTISKPLTLNCGLVLPNRLVKAAMAEQMSSKCKNYLPDEAVDAVYQTWARGGWGMVLTGNVQVDADYLGHPFDIAAHDSDAAIAPKVLTTWKRWAQTYNTAATSQPPPPLIMQLNHPGRQSPVGAGARSLCAQNLAPSAIPLDMGDGWLAKSVVSMVFGTPKAMGEEEISGVVARFAMAARLAAEAGFAGVEVHAAHGYLLSTFLTEKSNERTDKYGGSARNRARIVVEVVEAIRNATPKGFCVGVKLNSADHQTAEALRDSIEQIEAIAEAGIDFLEISGGSYEDPRMMADAGESDTPDVKVSSRTAAREAFFLDFAKSIRDHFPSLHLMVTGGFRTRAGMEAAVADSACDLVGIGRPAVLQPSAPKDIIFNQEISDQDARLREEKVDVPRLAQLSGIRGVGSGATSAWYSGQIQRLAKVK